jgi:hypothetical protein
MATVRLKAVESSFDPTPRQKDGMWQPDPVAAAETGLDGGFSMNQLKQGDYFVLANEKGYLPPLIGFTPQQLAKPSADVRKRMLKELQIVTVRAGQTSSVEVVLERGAAINGRLTFDDGTPAAGLSLMVELKNEDGRWDYVNRDPGGVAGDTTNDLGDFRVAGLSGGEYRLSAHLSLSPSMLGDGWSGQVFPTGTESDLDVYSGNAFREADAVPVRVVAGEEKTGVEIEIPIAKLHRVAGTVMSSNGNAVNAGEVSLRDMRDKKGDDQYVVSGYVSSEDGAFSFEFVPEGEYVLEVKRPRDVVRKWVEGPKVSRMEETPLHQYGDIEQPLTVKGSLTDVVVTVTENPTATPGVSAH